jgi:hypothetical protein
MRTATLAVALLLTASTLPAADSFRAKATVKNGELVRNSNPPARTWGIVQEPLFIPSQWQEQAPKPEPILDEKAPKIPEKKKGKTKSAARCPKTPSPS